MHDGGDLTSSADQGRLSWEVTLRLKPDRYLGVGWGVVGTALLRPERILVVASTMDQEVRILEPKGTSDIVWISG